MYEITFKFNGEIKTQVLSTEREAVRTLGHLDRADNAEVISHSENIDRSQYRI